MIAIPNGWSVRRIDETGEVLVGKQLSSRGHTGTQRAYLRVANVLDGRISSADIKSMAFSDLEAERYSLRFGDVLLNEGQSAELVGRTAMFRGMTEPVCFQNSLIRYRAGSTTCVSFAEQMFRYCQHNGVFKRIALRTSSIAHLGLSRFAALELPFPPLAEQERIAALLQAWDDGIDAQSRQALLQTTSYSLLTDSLAGPRTDARQLGTATRELNDRNRSLAFDRSLVMGVSNKDGIVPMRPQTIAADLSRYQVLPPRAFAYNPMRLDVGSVAMSRLDHDVIDEQQRIAGALDALRHEITLLDRKIELLRKSAGPFNILLNPVTRERFYERMNGMISAMPFEIIASVIDKLQLSARYTRPRNPYEVALLFCMERLHECMLTHGQNGRTVHVIFEGRGKNEDKSLELEFLRIAANSGGWGWKATDFSTIRYVPVFTKKDANSSGLQLADLTARPIALRTLRPLQSNRAYELIEPKILTRKRFP